MAVALEELVKQLEDSGIVAAGKIKDCMPPKAHPKDAEELARELVKQNHLTRFQAQQVVAGKAKALMLGNYTIIDKIGAGGMGQVFKAEHRRMHRIVAIKMLPPAMTKDAAALARFEREVTAAAKLEHPNIVTAHDADEANGAHFLVMQYVEGKDLSALVKKDGPFPVAKALNCILQAARGLEFAHKKGVVHRDIKPANLLLDNDGAVKILDMGLARLDASVGGAARPQAELTGTGTIMGTVDYMSPEQAFNTKHADARADIYSLGCSLHYLIVGKAAYDGESIMEKLLAHREKLIPSLRDAGSDVPDRLEAVFRKMLAKKVENRYQTMSEVVADLEQCQAAMKAAATGGTSVWKAPASDESSEMSLYMQNSKLKRISDDPFAVDEPPKKERRKKAAANNPPWKNTKLLIGAGAAGCLALLLGVWVIVKNDKGEEVGRIAIEVPKGGSVEVQAASTSATSTTRAPGVNPGIAATTNRPTKSEAYPGAHAPGSGVGAAVAKTPFSPGQALGYQKSWAKSLGVPWEAKNALGMKLVLIPPGQFTMGAPPEEIAEMLKMYKDAAGIKHVQSEGPQHQVTLTKPFYLGAYEVTVGQFRQFVDESDYKTEAESDPTGGVGMFEGKATKKPEFNWRNDGFSKSEDYPVSNIRYNDAVAFCNYLSQREKLTACYVKDPKTGWQPRSGNGYRLPAEAEWEYACRGGTTTAFYLGPDPKLAARHIRASSSLLGPARVGVYIPNPFGLYDMPGNVYEWCQDWFGEYPQTAAVDPTGPTIGVHRVERGGGYGGMGVPDCRSAKRVGISQGGGGQANGFRVVRSVEAVRPALLAVDRDAEAAERVLQLGGSIKIDLGGREQEVSDASELPPGPWRVVAVELKNKPTLTDGELSCLRGLEELRELELGSSHKVTDVGLAVLEGLNSLENLQLGYQAGISDAGLSHITSHALKGLYTGYTTVTAAGLRAVAARNKLEFISLGGKNFDTMFAAVPEIKTLTKIYMSGGTDAQVAKFATLKNLKSLSFHNPTASDAAIAALKKALPNCTVSVDKSPAAATPAATAADPDRKAANWALGKGGVVWINDTPVTEFAIKKAVDLPKDKFKLSTIVFTKGTVSDDECAEYLDGLQNVRRIAFNSSTITDASVSVFMKLRLERLDLMENDLTDAGISALRAGLPKCDFYWSGDYHLALGVVKDLGGTVRINGQAKVITDRKQLPTGLFRLTDIDVHGSAKWNDKNITGNNYSWTNLLSLKMDRTDTSDAALRSLATRAKYLKELSIKGTKVTAAGVAALQKALPLCKIEWDGAGKSAAGSVRPAAAPAKTK